ncbi:hypothetical protein J6590_038669 [Homalodisca vitripennis]|nr:hypothetical protein J6590_038669 [Homalodisca vitripennis]
MSSSQKAKMTTPGVQVLEVVTNARITTPSPGGCKRAALVEASERYNRNCYQQQQLLPQPLSHV